MHLSLREFGSQLFLLVVSSSLSSDDILMGLPAA